MTTEQQTILNGHTEAFGVLWMLAGVGMFAHATAAWFGYVEYTGVGFYVVLAVLVLLNVVTTVDYIQRRFTDKNQVSDGE